MRVLIGRVLGYLLLMLAAVAIVVVVWSIATYDAPQPPPGECELHDFDGGCI